MNWQPISSAPKDGTPIVAWSAGEGDPYVTKWCSFRNGFGESHVGWIEANAGETGPYPAEPTHWAPCTPTPVDEAKG